MVDTVEAVIEDWLTVAAAAEPLGMFLVIGDEQFSYAEVDARVGRLAGALQRDGVAPGDRVALRAANDLASVVALFAIWRADAAAVLINTRLTESEVATQLQQADVNRLIDSVWLGDYGARVDSDVSDPDWIAGAGHAEDDECLVVFTSGSSGSGRGVVLTWGNIDAGQAASAHHLAHASDDVWLAVLPLFHVGGVAILVRSAARCSTVILHDRFDIARVVADLGRSSLASLVATQLDAILNFDDRAFDVRAVLVGGGPAPQELLDRAYARGLGVLSTYGMTEAGSQIATSNLGRAPQRIVVALPSAEMRIVEHGHIEVRGAMVTTEYLDGPARTKGGWLSTGDLGISVNDGFQITGRSSEIIITGGENVMAGEVRAALEALPAVREAAVVGIPDDVWGEAVAVALVLNHNVSVDRLEEELRATLAGYKLPKVWRIVAELPRTSLGKIRRAAVQGLFT